MLTRALGPAAGFRQAKKAAEARLQNATLQNAILHCQGAPGCFFAIARVVVCCAVLCGGVLRCTGLYCLAWFSWEVANALPILQLLLHLV